MTRRAAAGPVAWVSGAAFLAVFAGLAFQMRQGHDPVLGAGHDGASAVVAPRKVLIRRVVKRRVIVRVIPAEPVAGSADGPLDAGRERPGDHHQRPHRGRPPAARPAAGARDEDS